MSRPLASQASPFEPLVFSRNVDVWLVSLSILVIRFAWVSVKIRLPSGSPIGPSVPVKPDLMTSIFVPAAMTPAIAAAVVSVAAGGCGGCAPTSGAAMAITAMTIDGKRRAFIGA